MTAKVSGLFVYPIKGVRGIALERARVERRGLAGDRRFMVVDETNTFLTQRTHPALARVDATFDGDALVIESDGLGEVRVPRAPEGPEVSVTVWKSTVRAVAMAGAPSEWFAALLGLRATLVYMPETAERPCSEKYGAPGDIVSFADAFPLLVANEASLDDLNARMETPLPMDRFRPNVVVSGAPAWDEDAWRRVRFGAVGARIVKGCDRCVVTTTDQRTGARGAEPLKTLATFRKIESAVYFGQNACPDDLGTIAVGDTVSVAERAPG